CDFLQDNHVAFSTADFEFFGDSHFDLLFSWFSCIVVADELPSATTLCVPVFIYQPIQGTLHGHLHLPLSSQPSGPAISAGNAFLRKYPLPKLYIPCTESTRTRQQVITPHPIKTCSQLLFKARPCSFEIVVPGHQRLVVIGSEIVQILHHEQTISRITDLTDRRQITVREDVLIYPRVRRQIGRA